MSNSTNLGIVRFSSNHLSVASGGIVQIDDYGRWPGCRQAVDEFLAARAPDLELHAIDYTGRQLVKP